MKKKNGKTGDKLVTTFPAPRGKSEDIEVKRRDNSSSGSSYTKPAAAKKSGTISDSGGVKKKEVVKEKAIVLKGLQPKGFSVESSPGVKPTVKPVPVKKAPTTKPGKVKFKVSTTKRYSSAKGSCKGPRCPKPKKK